MSEINDGGPAFPPHAKAFDYVGIETGMSLRDWFAGMAMQGLLSDGALRSSCEDFASAAYRMADAMLAAREGGAE